MKTIYKCFNCNKLTEDVQVFTCTRAEQNYLGCKCCKNYNVIQLSINENIVYPNVKSWNVQSVKNVLDKLIQTGETC